MLLAHYSGKYCREVYTIAVFSDHDNCCFMILHLAEVCVLFSWYLNLMLIFLSFLIYFPFCVITFLCPLFLLEFVVSIFIKTFFYRPGPVSLLLLSFTDCIRLIFVNTSSRKQPWVRGYLFYISSVLTCAKLDVCFWAVGGDETYVCRRHLQEWKHKCDRANSLPQVSNHFMLSNFFLNRFLTALRRVNTVAILENTPPPPRHYKERLGERMWMTTF